VFRPDYPIKTERLLLRPWREDDFEALHAIHSRADVARYLYWEPRTRNASRGVLARARANTSLDREHDLLILAAARPETDEVIGQANLVWTSVEHRQGELGYLVHPDHQRRGYATEIARALLRAGFEGAGLHRIIGRCDARNIGSAAVLEHAGMRREAYLRQNEFVKGEWTDELVYAALAEEWPDRHSE
jgi:RimJ/RimL family protein N-acetyltransferase